MTDEAPKHTALENILAWAGSDDKSWLAHVVTQEQPCGCQFNIDGFNQYCEAFQALRDLKAQEAERAIAFAEEDRRRQAIEKQKVHAKELGVPYELLP
jgi:hypothetical protein